MTDEAEAPTPEARALPGCDGVPAVLADGATWLLREGGLLNVLDDLRDALYDGATVNGEVAMGQVNRAALHMLQGNYNLDDLEAYTLLIGLGPEAQQALTDAVMLGLFGDHEAPGTFTVWAASALIANGIDPDSVPTSLLMKVLDQLVATGRAIKASAFVDSAVAAGRVAGFRVFAARQAAEKAARAVPAGPPTLISGTAPPAPDPIPEGVP